MNAYQEFLEEFETYINDKDFCSPTFSRFYGNVMWLKLLSDLEKLGINPLINSKEPIKKILSRFFESSDIKEIEIPEGVIEIGDSVFEGCRKLTKVIIPKTIKIIGSKAFMDCDNLKEIIFKGTKDYWQDEISRGFLWNHIGPKIIKCIDGEINYEK